MLHKAVTQWDMILSNPEAEVFFSVVEIPQSNDSSLKLCKKEATSYLFHCPQYIFALIRKLVSISEVDAKTLSEIPSIINVQNSFSKWRNCSSPVPSGIFMDFSSFTFQFTEMLTSNSSTFSVIPFYLCFVSNWFLLWPGLCFGS